jgi:hypothetical protein
MLNDRRTLCRLMLTLAFVAPISAWAQVPSSPPAPVTINGVVSDQTGRGIPDVEVSLPVLKLLVRTDSAGRFRFADLPPAAYFIRARRVGFHPNDGRLPPNLGPRLMRIVMTPTDVTLDTVVVREKCAPRGYAGFVCRQNANGGGAFLDAAAIDSTKSELLGDLFIDRPHFRVTVNPRSGYKYPSLSDHTCLVTLVDGIPAASTNPLPVYARQIVGVEIYDKPMDAPKAYQQYTWKGREPCGLIVYWTSRSR